jgi:hypothetical protein
LFPSAPTSPGWLAADEEVVEGVLAAAATAVAGLHTAAEVAAIRAMLPVVEVIAVVTALEEGPAIAHTRCPYVWLERPTEYDVDVGQREQDG